MVPQTISPGLGAASAPLKWRDVALLLVLCALLYGWGAFSGAPLTMHEARLPQLAREMLHGGQWLLPESGGRPWLERPPVPHWLTAAGLAIFRTHAEWAARLPAALAGTLLVLLVAWMGGRWFGRGVGLLSGAVMATCFEVYRYATLAEDDIYLAVVVAAAMACFVKAEWSCSSAASPEVGERGFWGWRHWAVAAFFVLLGATNWIKGPLVGAVPVVATAVVYLAWNALQRRPMGGRDWGNLRRYVWFWGWLIFLVLAIAWPYLAWRRYPSIWDNWMYDYRGQGEENFQFAKPFWYYLVVLPGMALIPWTPAVVAGTIAVARRAWRQRGSAERFVCCWAIVSLLVLSVPGRKHHHYLLPTIAPWAILGAIGLRLFSQVLFNGKGPEWSRRIWFGLLVLGIPGAAALLLWRHQLPGPAAADAALAGVWIACIILFYFGLSRRIGLAVMSSILLGMVAGFGYVQVYVAGEGERTAGDMAFLERVPEQVPVDQPLYINAAVTSLDFFRLQWYLPDRAKLLHNLTYLRDSAITGRRVYIVTRARDAAKLRSLGAVRQVDQSAHTRRENSPADRFTLFELTFAPGLERYPATEPIDVMQAMERRAGPFLGRP